MKEEKKITYNDIKNDVEINALIRRGNDVMKVMGYTEHSERHAAKVAECAGSLLMQLGYDEHQVELAKMAGYIHDIGNAINRHDHAHNGGMLAYQILKERGMALEDILTIVTAIGHHDEKTGTAIDAVSAALILADKTDVRRNRVQATSQGQFDIHDRVNYAVLSSSLEILEDKKVIQMNMELDDTMCSVMDYFEIFLQRMVMCRRAAELLGYRFKLVANGSKLC